MAHPVCIYVGIFNGVKREDYGEQGGGIRGSRGKCPREEKEEEYKWASKPV